MKVVSIAGLVVLALVFGLIAYGSLYNLWGYQDGSPETYLHFGLPPLFVSLASIAAVVVVVRR